MTPNRLLLAALACTALSAATVVRADAPLPRPSPLRAAPAPAVAPVQWAQAGTIVGGIPIPRPKPATAATGGLFGNLIRGVGAVAELAQPKSENSGGLLGDLLDGTLGLETALRMAASGDIDGATRVAANLPDRADTLVVEWVIASTGGPAVSADRIRQAIGKLEGWPGQTLLRLRYEQAVIRAEPDSRAAIAAFSAARPTSEPGVMMLTRAYLAEGRRADAAALIGPYWRDQNFSREAEDTILAEFKELLTPEQHRARLWRLMYSGRVAEGLRVAPLLDADTQKLAAAFAAVRRNNGVAAALDAVPAALRTNPNFIYAQATSMRRAGRLSDAARLILTLPADTVITAGGDVWSELRRDLSRQLMERGDGDLAYRLLEVNPASGREEQVALEFQAGWYALRFRNDIPGATRHFIRLKELSPTPLTQSRAEYWLGRTAEASGDATAATAHYTVAAGYPTTFYGQVATTRIGATQLEISGPPAPDETARARLRQEHELVRVAERLAQIERPGDAAVFSRYLAEILTDPNDLSLLAASAEARGAYQLGLQIGIIAAARGVPVQTLAFPTAAIPTAASTGNVERSILYAIARQESKFDQVARSPAGALGLLQLMPATAREIAGTLGLPYSQSRLTSDPAYNTTLGATHFARVFEEWGNNFVLSFAAYNAGSGRVRDWIATYGDPRNASVDVIDWIEHIPFDETRNYVQRVMENLQVYRVRMGEPTLRILADLGRRPAG